MIKQFFCIIDEAIDGGYKVVISAENINLIPKQNITIRRIYTEYDLQKGSLVYVSRGELEKGKLVAKSLFMCIEPSEKRVSFAMAIQVKLKPIIKEKIADEDIHPIEVFKTLCG
jgi:hypothetical protein